MVHGNFCLNYVIKYVKIFLFFPWRLCSNEQFIYMYIVTCIRWMLQIQYNFNFYTFGGPLAQSQQPKINAFIRDG